MSAIVTVDGRAYAMTGRVAAMVLFLVGRRSKIDEMQKGAIEFHFAGRSLKVGFHEVLEMTIPSEAPVGNS